MAFENVFGNIDFQAPVRAEQAKQAQFAKMLGMGIDAAQRKRQLDMQERQLKAKANEFNLDKNAQAAGYRIKMGQEQPGDRELVETFQAFQQPVMNQLGNIIQPADVLGNLGVQRSGMQAQMMGAPQVDPRTAQVDNMMAGMTGAVPDGTPLSVDMLNPQVLEQPITDIPPIALDMSEPAISQEMRAPSPIVEPPKAKIDLPADVATSPFGKKLAAEKSADLQMKYAEADYNQRLSMQKELFDDFIINKNSLPLIDDMIKYNRETIDMPYADLLQPGTRLLSSDQADAFEMLNQNRLEMAAPLAKQLGVNPTDKDFQASLDRIANLNATKSGREKQLSNLRKRIEQKIEQTGEKAPVSYLEYFK